MAFTNRRQTQQAAGQSRERRTARRTPIGLQGKLFLPERELEGDCTVLDLSSGGAGLKSSSPAGIGTRIVLYVSGFGRLEGKVIARDRLRIGVQFAFSDAKRERVDEMISAYLVQGEVNDTTLRASYRVQNLSSFKQFTLASGESEECEVLDIALSGVSLKTATRPVVGETIHFGNMTAVVVRHTEQGISVKFVGPEAKLAQ
ncbi:MAG TPA: PilZ domain-containing protein [Rhizomicrobium sp.]|jgi:hypothetical protein